jgi:branched-chain amino acid transport system substrate-binding protein
LDFLKSFHTIRRITAMKKSISKILVIFIGLVLSISLGVGSAAAAPVVKEWKVPFLIFLTGPYAGFGKQIKWGVDEAVREINAAGGIAGRPIVIEYHDTGIDPAKAAAEMSKVVEHSLVIFGPIGAPPAKAALPLVAREKAFAMAVTIGAEISIQFQPYTVHLTDTFEKVTPPAVNEWIKRNSDMKKVVQFLFPLDPTFAVVIKVQEDIMKAHGIEVMPTVELGEGVDMASAVVKAMADKPDGFTIMTLPIDAAKIMKELDKRGVKDKSKILGACVVDDPSFYELGKGCINGTYLWNFVNSMSEKPKWKALFRKYREAFPEFKDPTFGVIFNYDMVYLTKMAIEATGATGDPAKLAEERKKIMDYCRNLKGFPGVQYDYDTIDGLGRTPTFLFQVQGDQKQLVKTFAPM